MRIRLPRYLLAATAALGLVLSMPSAWAQRVKLQTSAGDIVLELQRDYAPKTVDNFLSYVRFRHYDGTIFHRVIKDFMIQGGGLDARMQEKPTQKPIPLEDRNGLKNVRGTIAMARTADPNSATSQFFINVVDNPGLDHGNTRDGNGYAVFGQVVQGMDVVDKIREVPVRPAGGHGHVPTMPVTIIKATLLEN
jgi:peptidyl-prolyl cis-trans isomerase A (cyclophilin A)